MTHMTTQNPQVKSAILDSSPTGLLDLVTPPRCRIPVRSFEPCFLRAMWASVSRGIGQPMDKDRQKITTEDHLRWSEVVARGGVEPSTSDFQFKVHLIERTTRHFACRSYVVEAPGAPRALELLDSPLDTL